MEKLIELLRERKTNFDENHILDMMYSDGTIFIKDGKPIYAYDSIISPATERMIINGKIGFIKRLIDNNKIDRDKVEKEKVDYYYIEMFDNDEIMLMLLSISDTPIEDLISYLK